MTWKGRTAIATPDSGAATVPEMPPFSPVKSPWPSLAPRKGDILAYSDHELGVWVTVLDTLRHTSGEFRRNLVAWILDYEANAARCQAAQKTSTATPDDIRLLQARANDLNSARQAIALILMGLERKTQK